MDDDRCEDQEESVQLGFSGSSPLLAADSRVSIRSLDPMDYLGLLTLSLRFMPSALARFYIELSEPKVQVDNKESEGAIWCLELPRAPRRSLGGA